MVDYRYFQKSLTHLKRQFEHYKKRHDTLQKIDDEQSRHLTEEALAESVIQRFETCWDCLWKVLKRYLENVIGLHNVPNGPNPILRLANENNLLSETIETWLSYSKARINTSHDYSGEKAKDVLELMDTFINNAMELYQRMSKTS